MNAIAAEVSANLDREPLVLIVDDEEVNRMVIRRMLQGLGYRVIEAVNGKEACEVCLEVQPDLVLMDVMMPDMNGLDATVRIKRHFQDAFVPVVFLTAIADEKELLRCIEHGGDDFIVKPISRLLLKSKVEANLRIRAIHSRLAQHRDELKQHQNRVREELAIAAKILAGVADTKHLMTPNVRHLLQPMEAMNGDLILASRRPSGEQIFLVGDFTGHGLPAAIGAQAVASIFNVMAQKGIAIEQIATELNAKLKSMLPVGRFFACCIFELHGETGVARIFNGGMPDVLINDASGKLAYQVPSENIPLGIVGEVSPTIRSVPLNIGDRLAAYSDGVIEAHAPDGELFGEQRLRAVLATVTDVGQALDAVINGLNVHTQGGAQRDDISLLLVEHCEYVAVADEIEAVAAIRQSAGTWNYHVTLNADDLRRGEPIAMITQVLEAAQGLGPVRAQLFTMLTELYSNALEHGILDLDSAIKQKPDGFIEYYGARAERLAVLQNAKIEIVCDHRPVAGGGELVVRMTHNGVGIPPEFAERLEFTQGTTFSGRGIPLLRKLCRELRYENEGCSAVATYFWQTHSV